MASVAAGVLVRNIAAHGLLPTMLELPVGSMVHRYAVPLARPGRDPRGELHHPHRAPRRDPRRAGHPRGAATRSAMLLARRRVDDVREILVRPPMVPMDSLGAGLLRDLEGVSTDAVSQSDLAFHALREYVPGDDLRHVHWRSSAKAMASTTSRAARAAVPRHPPQPRHAGRRRHRRRRGPTPEDFETAMSVAASILVRAMLDEFDMSFVCGTSASSGVDRPPRPRRRLPRRVRHDRAGVLGPPRRRRLARHQPAVPGRRRGERLRELPARGRRPSRPRCAATPSSSTRPGTSRVTETGGLVVVQIADKADLGALLRWTQR